MVGRRRINDAPGVVYAYQRYGMGLDGILAGVMAFALGFPIGFYISPKPLFTYWKMSPIICQTVCAEFCQANKSVVGTVFVTLTLGSFSSSPREP